MRAILRETVKATGVLALMITGMFDGDLAMALSEPDPDPRYCGSHRRGVAPRIT
jgi:hypothetical protein